MNPTAPQQPQPPQKLIDFNEELKALCLKYQYELRPVMHFDQLQGIGMSLQATDVSPKDEGVQLNTTQLAPDPVPPTTIESPAGANDPVPEPSVPTPEPPKEDAALPETAEPSQSSPETPVDNQSVN